MPGPLCVVVRPCDNVVMAHITYSITALIPTTYASIHAGDRIGYVLTGIDSQWWEAATVVANDLRAGIIVARLADGTLDTFETGCDDLALWPITLP